MFQIRKSYPDFVLTYIILGLFYLNKNNKFYAKKYWNVALNVFPENIYLRKFIELFQEDISFKIEFNYNNIYDKNNKKEILIEINKLRKVYYSKNIEILALKDINLKIYKNETLAILGPNGSGKTTLIEILEGIKKPTGGEVTIYYNNFKLTDIYDNLNYKKLINVQLQKMNLIDVLTVNEIIDFFYSIKNQYFKKDVFPLEELIEYFELKEYCKKIYRNLSPGEKQKIHLILGLIGDPEILFFDEPTSELDPYSRHKFWECINYYKERKNVTIIYTTHYLEEAEKFSNRVVLLNKGNIVFEGHPMKVINKFNDKAKLVIEFKNTKDILEVIPNVKSMNFNYSVDIENNILEFNVSKHNLTKNLDQIIHFINEQNYDFESLYIKQPTLEEVFIELQKNNKEK